jgi:hypothetical protein
MQAVDRGVEVATVEGLIPRPDAVDDFAQRCSIGT